jgi:hypothetical protein
MSTTKKAALGRIDVNTVAQDASPARVAKEAFEPPSTVMRASLLARPPAPTRSRRCASLNLATRPAAAYGGPPAPTDCPRAPQDAMCREPAAERVRSPLHEPIRRVTIVEHQGQSGLVFRPPLDSMQADDAAAAAESASGAGARARARARVCAAGAQLEAPAHRFASLHALHPPAQMQCSLPTSSRRPATGTRAN